MALPKKKALLVGLQYEAGKDHDADNKITNGPHYDVTAMKVLLVEIIASYGYASNDVVVMIDRDDPGQIQPTYINVTQGIRDLVKDARPGDHFFFLYSGHTENIEYSDRDGVDECMVPSDGEMNLIAGEELRDIVDTLPIGSNLVIVFDCASGLDLEHRLCNRAYLPWIMKKKKQSESHWRTNAYSRTFAPAKRQKPLIDESHLSKEPNTIRKALSSKQVAKEPSPNSSCTGWCPPMGPKNANVICISACGPGQLPWEDWGGSLMTKALINTLRKDPHPALVDLLADISHQLYATYLGSHGNTREHVKEVKDVNRRRIARGLPPTKKVDMQPEFQDPQISSHRPLDRDAKWDP